MNRKIFLLLLAVAAAVAFVLLRPTLFVFVGDEAVYCERAVDGTNIKVMFIHSVQKTPVEENLVTESNGFRLISTRYQSFGVGLPFLSSEGNFRHEGKFFVMDGMNRFYRKLAFRIGIGTDFMLDVGGVRLNLYEHFPVGAKVDVFVAPFYVKFVGSPANL